MPISKYEIASLIIRQDPQLRRVIEETFQLYQHNVYMDKYRRFVLHLYNSSRWRVGKNKMVATFVHFMVCRRVNRNSFYNLNGILSDNRADI